MHKAFSRAANRGRLDALSQTWAVVLKKHSTSLPLSALSEDAMRILREFEYHEGYKQRFRDSTFGLEKDEGSGSF